MSYRINSTGRERLFRENISIKMGPEIGGVPSFVASLDIPGNAGFDPAAKIYVEPYVKSSTMRFDFGTVGHITPPDVCLLTDIDVGTGVLFRVKIVDETEDYGRILAAANGIRPDSESDGSSRKSLLPVKALNLGEILWRVEIDPHGGPILLLNNRIAGVLDRIKSDVYLQAAIYPEVVRQVAKFIFLHSDLASEDAEWCADWTVFFERVIGRGISEEETADDEASEALVEVIADSFAKQQRYVTKLVSVEF